MTLIKASAQSVFISLYLRFKTTIEATGMTPEEYENGDSMIALFAREGEVVGWDSPAIMGMTGMNIEIDLGIFEPLISAD